MAKTRFFQHLNEKEKDFQQITTLDCIDNSDGFTMYYFKDGTKCNKRYIAPVNANSIEGYEFAEISSPDNKWVLNVSGLMTTEKPKPVQGKDGNWYEAPELSDKPSHNFKRVSVLKRPIFVSNYNAPNDNDYLYNVVYNSNNQEFNNTTNNQSVFDFNDSNAEIIEAEIVPVNETIINNVVPMQTLTNVENDFFTIDENIIKINVEDLMNSGKKIQICFKNDNGIYELTPNEFIENLITPPQEKIVEKIVKKEVLVKTSDTDIELGIDETQQCLLDNMIDMSNKIECSIDMELTLKLPPVDVYKLIKSAYPEGMDRGFVNIIANRMQIKELKTSVADGLMSFYDEEYNNSSEIDKKVDVKKPVHKK